MRTMITGISTGLVMAMMLVRPCHADGLPVYFAIGGALTQTEGVADTDATVGGFPPPDISVSGSLFDDDSSAWSVDVGYQFTDFFALEIGYEDLGSFGAEFPVFVGSYSPSTTLPRVDLADFPVVGVLSAPLALPEPPDIRPSAFNVTARFSVPLTDRFSALWHAGLERAEFDVVGSASVLVRSDTNPSMLERISVPYADPGNETGYSFGFGIGWTIGRHFGAELTYARKDLRVLQFDSFGLRLVGRL